jgi:peptidoglycan/xylan/chitin deacetylase (PgdA/CDA1 family)
MLSFFNSVPVLNYHKISPKFELGLTSVHPNLFKQQMSYLKSLGYQTITTKDYAQDLNKKIIITFDDAYENIYEYAFPILKELGFTAIVFVITDYIGQYNLWDANLLGIKFKHMSREHLQELHLNEWEIGSHSASHHVKKIDLECKKELNSSKLILEELTQSAVKSFAFPFGYKNKKLQEMAEQEYSYIFKSTFESISSNAHIPRMNVYKFDNLKSLEKKISLDSLEALKLRLIHSGAFASELWQRAFKT